MVTADLEHRAATLAQPTATAATTTAERSYEAVVRDTDGHPLVCVEMTRPLNGSELTLVDVDDQSLLMTYYFGRGGREVMLTLPDDVVRARLETCWAGDHRSWWLDLRN
jgi:hypothetical protein